MDQAKIIESFHQGHCTNAYQLFGAHFTYEGCEGVRFTVYAPHARNVSVIGGFTNWEASPARMERTGFEGVWSVFIPGVREWESYKYMIEDRRGNKFNKADPYAFYSETRPETASKVYNITQIRWTDKNWMKKRSKNFDRPLNIYEVYAGDWKKNGEFPYTYKMMEDNLIPYVKEHGFTHIELMPLNEYPFDGSWGYQASGYFAVTSRYGNPTEFAAFVNKCHKEGIGVIMDMVPVHFVKDEFGLRYFDGEPLYEYRDRNDAESQWGTMNFDLWNEEVRSFLISAAAFWCDVYHIDGIRIDAVSNLIYWGGNSNRGTNEGSLAFVRRMNYYINKEFPTVMLIAEDSSDFPKVTASTLDNGLGFDYKWDLGWMNDTLKYYATDPIYRVWDHNKLTFSMAYFYSEKFMMTLSHDENVHGKKTIVDRMWGDYDAKFSQVRNLYAYMYAHPGKKLNFMGNEIASFREFDEKKELDWFLLSYPRHNSFLRYFTDLNKIYNAHACLYKYDYDPKGFKWIDADNARQSIYSFYREDEKEYLVCVLNMTPQQYEVFEIGVPQEGTYTEILNSEKDIYDGCNMCNFEPAVSHKSDSNVTKFASSITIRIAPFAAIWFTCPKKRSRSRKAVKAE
ncbi:MAG: 1,4-alpha-glucan branching protein GlgB [Solobacterium sp.]|nr:1,4-alpha-glucan branching protein GlgB [Solobacterium sp.]